MSFRFVLALAAVLLLSSAAIADQPAAVAPPSTEVQKLLADADAAVKSQNIAEALKLYKKADKEAKHTCVRCLSALMNINFKYQQFKESADAAERLASLQGLSPESKASAEYMHGVALMQMASGKKDYQKSEADFRAALKDDPQLAMAKYELAMSLLKQNRDDEGMAEMKEYLPSASNDMRATAQRIIDNPKRGRQSFVPEFSIKTLSGEQLTNRDLEGKVVVLDFWATWCGPCRESVPHLRDFARKYSENKNVVLLSVSADQDADKWRSFIEKNQMTWPQYYDGDGHIAHMFRVDAFPTYYVIDAEGIVKAKAVGSSLFTNDTLESTVKKCLKEMRRDAEREAQLR